ncbi:MAG: SpoVR family protein [Azospirillaceae bacterium]|nr:SpoVR family protein [Azospirillaceae bacterium]
MADTLTANEPLYTGADWDFDKIKRVYDAIEQIAVGEMKLEIYRNQIEVITAEQMLDAYSSIGMPLMYKHWSFGKHFARDELLYRKGLRGLAYEIVINSSPCISYIMEENTMTMQTLVLAHAAFGHNHFFKNNHLFQQWTDARGILDYLDFAKSYVSSCEERYGFAAVERVLDAAHALMNHGVHRYPRKRPLDLRDELKRDRERQAYEEQIYNDLWRTVPRKDEKGTLAAVALADRKKLLALPEENILYFLEKRSPKLQPWQREILRIVRKISQYFYPQKQTKLMNEGCATFVHYKILNRMHEKGQIEDGHFLEFLHSHTGVVFQPDFDDPRFSGINPYALGFAMMQDIERIATDPTDEDRAWFPDIAGNGEPMATLRTAWSQYRDESFVLQFLSPALIRKLKLFKVKNDAAESHLLVEAIHDDRGYKQIRSALARQYDLAYTEPDIQVVDVNLAGDRKLILQHNVINGIPLDESNCKQVMRLIANLWGYEVKLIEVDARTGATLREHSDIAPTAPV